MKTKDKILLTSLSLFNQEAEASVSTVDIANELDISPGNLYYHFKGKEVIIGELLKQHLAALAEILNNPAASLHSLEDYWMYLYVLSEQVFDYRFVYRNPSELILRFPELKKPLLNSYQKTEVGLGKLVVAMRELGIISFDESVLVPLCQNLNLLLNQWFSYIELTTKVSTPDQAVHSMVFQLMQLLIPYGDASHQDQLQAIQAAYTEV